MADVLIKGMDIPQNCDECSFTKMESEFHGICTAIRNDVCYVYPDKGKPDWCPLVEVPTHGRLIDADRLYNKWIWGNTDRTADTKCIELIDLSLAPTVLEANE